MKQNKSKIFFIFTVVLFTICFSFVLFAENEEINDEFIRENPEMIFCEAKSDENLITYPDFIDVDANHIEMNGDDWSDLLSAIQNIDNNRLNIVHIGDSHLQADIATSVIRSRLTSHYGSGGRALVIPFKIAGTNQPTDYSINFSAPSVASRLLKKPWQCNVGFTGVGVHPLRSEFDISISSKEPFDSIMVFFSGDSLSIPNSESSLLAPGVLTAAIDTLSNDITFHVNALPNVDIHGFNLINGHAGISYHVIGNNGATYNSYNNLPDFSEKISYLSPRLIVISLGTNEAFGKMSDLEMKQSILSMISSLKRYCPDVHFLLATPSECQRRTYRGKGRKRRRTGYAVNDNIRRIRNIIIEYGRDNGIPVYDFYAVAGGDGSSAKWLRDNLMNRDRIHLLRDGYVFQGHLFSDALEEVFANIKVNPIND